MISRPAGGKLARGVVESLKSARGYTDALEVAIRTGGSGFDAYIIVLAWRRTPY